MQKKFLKLTDIHGQPILVNKSKIEHMAASYTGGLDAESIVYFDSYTGRVTVPVKETVDEIDELLYRKDTGTAKALEEFNRLKNDLNLKD